MKNKSDQFSRQYAEKLINEKYFRTQSLEYSPVNVKQMKKIERYAKWSGAELSPNYRRVSN